MRAASGSSALVDAERTIAAADSAEAARLTAIYRSGSYLDPFSAVFYSYGLGLFGRVGAATGVAMAVTLYAGQLVVSRWWLARLGEGPVERVWRRLTYGRRQAQVDRNGNPSTPSAPVFTAST